MAELHHVLRESAGWSAQELERAEVLVLNPFDHSSRNEIVEFRSNRPVVQARPVADFRDGQVAARLLEGPQNEEALISSLPTGGQASNCLRAEGRVCVLARGVGGGHPRGHGTCMP